MVPALKWVDVTHISDEIMSPGLKEVNCPLKTKCVRGESLAVFVANGALRSHFPPLSLGLLPPASKPGGQC